MLKWTVPCSIFFLLVDCVRGQEKLGEPVIPAAAVEDRQAGEEEVTPSHVFRQVRLIRSEIDLIRLEMGRSTVEPLSIHVEKAAPREVYFQALTLFRKADRLAFEHTRERAEEPPLPSGEILPADVLSMVNAATVRVSRVKETLGIGELTEPFPLDPDIDPSQVFNLIVIVNRELSHLLDQQFSPGDVYQQVTVAIAYAARLIDSPGEVSTPPEPPPLERRKRPHDVFLRLVETFDVIRQIGEKSGVSMLDLEVDAEQIERAEPSDVYDIASLLVSELSHLHGLLPDAAPPRRVYSQGRKLPAQVYQRIGILFAQMELLKQKVEINPNWLED